MMRRPAALIVLALMLTTALAAAQQAPTVVRVFQLRSLSLGEATALVQPELSSSGTLTVTPKDKTLTVQDRQDVVDRVGRMLAEADRRSTSYHLVVRLLEASDAGLPEGSRAVVVDERVKKMFRYASYWELAATEVRGDAGMAASARLGERFTIRFEPKAAPPAALGIWRGTAGRGKSAKPAVDPQQHEQDAGWTVGQPDPRKVMTPQRMLLHNLILLDGSTDGEPLLRTNVSIGPNQTVVLGATPSEGSGRALILILEARPE